MKILALAMVSLTLTGCLTGGDSSEKRDLNPQASNSVENRKDYEAALAKWRGSRVSDYAFRINLDCFCFPMGWMDIEVEEGVVTRVDSVPGQEVLFDPDQFGLAPSVDHLFHTIATHIDLPDFTVEVEYDKVLGYPRSVEIRSQGSQRDADYTIGVSGLEAR